MPKTDESYVPLSRGIVEHLKIIKGMPVTVYLYLLAEAKYTGPEKGTLKKKISDIAADIEIDYKTVQLALNKLKGKYITVKPAKNQHSLTEFKILKYKTVNDFIKVEQQPETPVATPEAPPVASSTQVLSTVKNSSDNTDLQPPKKLRSKEGKKDLKKQDLILPDWLPVETWKAYLKMRKAKGKKFEATEYAQELIIKKLTKFKERGQDIKAILEQSIVNSWQGVFEVKQEKGGNPGDQRAKFLKED